MNGVREYKAKDVEMLLASKTISLSFVTNIEELSVIRSTWTEVYAKGISVRIDRVIDNYLGLDKKRELREATSKLKSIQMPSLRDLSFLKTQVEVDFKDSSKEILKQLGYGNNLRDLRNGDQEALIQLLYAFRKGMTTELKEQISSAGTNPVLIDRIIKSADELSNANITQESLKETTKEISHEAIIEFNKIYNEIIGICKIAASYYHSDKIMKEQFTFSKVVGNMNVTRKTAELVE